LDEGSAGTLVLISSATASHFSRNSLSGEREEIYVISARRNSSALRKLHPSLFGANVIERSVIVSETQTFSVDESWLHFNMLRTTRESKIKELTINKNRFKPDLLKDS
jgi:hypothetical protein